MVGNLYKLKVNDMKKFIKYVIILLIIIISKITLVSLWDMAIEANEIERLKSNLYVEHLQTKKLVSLWDMAIEANEIEALKWKLYAEHLQTKGK